MIQEAHGNLLQADVDALVNTVNTVGVMGKGIALQFKRAHPENFDAYAAGCQRGEVVLGRVFVYRTGQLARPHFILNFPTKGHWRAKSKIEDVEAGLRDLRGIIGELDIKSIAVPPLGCGNGGLDWSDVRPLIERELGDIPDVTILVYPPEGAPDAHSMVVRTPRPAMNQQRAGLILALARYIDVSTKSMLSMDGKLSLVEAHKVGYFLQFAGWPLGLEFVPSHYGPYCQRLNEFISDAEGHFFTGFGDGTGGSRATLEIHEDAVTEARGHVDGLSEFRHTLARFESLIEGFEFPYGIELLSTVHYVAEHIRGEVTVESVMAGIDSWSARKSSLFKPAQASVALEHLTRQQAVSA